MASVLLVPGAATANAASGFTSDLEKALKRMDRKLCRSIEGIRCKHKAPAAKSPARKTKAKPAAAKPAAKKPIATDPATEQPATAKLVPIPRQKPVLAVEAKAAANLGATAAQVPKPRLKPAMPPATPDTATTESPSTAPTPAPLPRAKPPLVKDEPVSQVTVLVPSVTIPKVEMPPAAPPPDDTCRNALQSLGMDFVTPATSVDTGQCTVADPVKLASFNSGGETIAFPDGPVLNCNFALRFGEWLKAEGAPIAKQTAKSAIDKFYTGPGFQCRGRNGDGSAKISEHGLGNAVDITFFKLKDGRTFQASDALDPMSPAYQTLAEFRASACKYFSTVLGPGSNAAHADHLHFDLGKHGKSGTYMICE